MSGDWKEFLAFLQTMHQPLAEAHERIGRFRDGMPDGDPLGQFVFHLSSMVHLLNMATYAVAELVRGRG